MKFVINKKVYDTEKMTILGIVRKWYAISIWFWESIYGKGTGRFFDCQLYRSQKGSYLLVHAHADGKHYGEAIPEDEAKSLLAQADYEAYCKYFGELEEA